MAKIVYEFEIQNFSIAEGYTHFEVRHGRLELDKEPGPALLALIERYEGKRPGKPEQIEDKPKKKTRKTTTKTEADPWR